MDEMIPLASPSLFVEEFNLKPKSSNSKFWFFPLYHTILNFEFSVNLCKLSSIF